MAGLKVFWSWAVWWIDWTKVPVAYLYRCPLHWLWSSSHQEVISPSPPHQPCDLLWPWECARSVSVIVPNLGFKRPWVLFSLRALHPPGEVWASCCWRRDESLKLMRLEQPVVACQLPADARESWAKMKPTTAQLRCTQIAWYTKSS